MAKANEISKGGGGGGKKAIAEKKGATQTHLTEEDRALEEESRRLLRKATAIGGLSTVKSSGASLLKPAKTILKCDGKDIVKKGQRKSKYLFSFPGLMAPVAAGKLGELAHLDSQNPVLYIDFPQGRLKLLGTLVYPKNKYLTLQFAKGAGNIVCDDCFESLVVFSESCWVGKKEDNPEEFPLEMPEDLIKEKMHSEFSYAGGAGCRPGDEVKPGEEVKPKAVASSARAAPIKPRLTSPVVSKALSSPEKSKGKKDDREGSDDSEGQGMASDILEALSGPRRQSQRATRKISYTEEADDDDAEDIKERESDDDDDDDDDQSTAKRRTPVKRKTKELEGGSPAGGSVQHPAKSPKIGTSLKGSNKQLSKEDDKDMPDQNDDEIVDKDIDDGAASDDQVYEDDDGAASDGSMDDQVDEDEYDEDWEG